MIPTRQPELPAHRLTAVIDYMRAHFNQPVTVSELAKQCGLSSTHFTRAFREALGKPPHAYLIELRLDKARDLLEHTRLPITEIALSCGFEQSQYFATVFRQRIGFTPSSWRTRVAGTVGA
jgi:AraC family transcriptional regulator